MENWECSKCKGVYKQLDTRPSTFKLVSTPIIRVNATVAELINEE